MLGITSGLNTRGGMLTSELNASQIAAIVEILALVGEWFVRFDQDDPLEGPYSFTKADAVARWRSREKNESKADLVTFLGARAGDPVTDPERLFVTFLYIHGKRTLGGRMAEFNSSLGEPYIFPDLPPDPNAPPEGQVTLNGNTLVFNGIPVVFTS